MNYPLVLSLAIVLLASCAAPQKQQTFAEFAQQYESLKEPVPDRVIFEFHEACNDEGQCIVSQDTVDAAVKVITKLNDAYQQAIAASNTRLDAIAHCEYANHKKDQAISLIEQKSDKLELISSIKQVVTGLACAGLLMVK